jgi:hypothetical protein
MPDGRDAGQAHFVRNYRELGRYAKMTIFVAGEFKLNLSHWCGD